VAGGAVVLMMAACAPASIESPRPTVEAVPARTEPAEPMAMLPPPAAAATARLVNREGEPVGTATLTQRERGVEIALDVRGLPANSVLGFHVHEAGRCDTPTFESAGGHFNPASRQHGMEHAGGPHAGDLPNVRVGADGTARLAVLNPHVSLGAGEASLLREGGTALVIHARRDDYHSQPTGDAGDRVACGVIRRG
jgi:superoxide dismutase, Cu-Zn family